MKNRFKIPESIEPYSGIIYFVVLLMLSHFFWKFTVLGDETETIVTFFGMNISAPFNLMADHVAKVTTRMLEIMGYSISLSADNVVRHDNNVAVHVVWACTGLKQAYIFVCIIAFYRGTLKNKLWFIPLGLLVVYLFNIFRIVVITALIKENPEWFYILHEHVFKYLFYVIIFGMWILWEEVVSKKTVQPQNNQ